MSQRKDDTYAVIDSLIPGNNGDLPPTDISLPPPDRQNDSDKPQYNHAPPYVSSKDLNFDRTQKERKFLKTFQDERQDYGDSAPNYSPPGLRITGNYQEITKPGKRRAETAGRCCRRSTGLLNALSP